MDHRTRSIVRCSVAVFAAAIGCGVSPLRAAGSPEIPAWRGREALCSIVPPRRDEKAARLVVSTINGYLERSYGVELPVAAEAMKDGTYVVAGTPENSPVIAELARAGLQLATAELGDEGFQLATHEVAARRCIVIHGTTPRALKHGCQELVFFRMPATRDGGSIDGQLSVVKRPAFAYRGTYMLPCWAAHDSAASWERVLRFNSELTLNRSWFWLDGFPVAGHTGEYAGTDLANPEVVQRLLDLAVAEDMKILIGGGWFTWHHGKAVGKDLKKGIEYYLKYLDAFKNFHGFYIEPTGEGSETKGWAAEQNALCDLIGAVLGRRPEFEFALAIGKFNNQDYRASLASFDPKRVYLWWCWGDPIRDKALELYPSILRWHTIVRMSDYHGSMDPPRPEERALTGFATSYDPGQGFGNPWNGWGSLGAEKPRNLHPHTIPYFAHQYFFRERCWDLSIDEAGLARRLGRRLFDADAPGVAAAHYLRLSNHVLAVNQKKAPPKEELAPIRAFVAEAKARSWTPRTADTLARMEDALAELAKR